MRAGAPAAARARPARPGCGCDRDRRCRRAPGAAEVEALALDRGGVEQRPLRRGEQVDGRPAARAARGGDSAARAARPVHRQLLEEERVAARPGRDRRPLSFREGAARGEQPRLSSGLSGPSCTAPGPRRAAASSSGTGEAQQQHRRVGQLRVEVVHEVEQRRFRPLDVLEQSTSGPSTRNAPKSRRNAHGDAHRRRSSPRPRMALTEAAAADPSCRPAVSASSGRPLPPGAPSRGPASR